MVDVIEAVRALLLADTAVQDIAGTAVYGSELPVAATASQPTAAVVLKPSGGPGSPGGGYQQYGKTRVDVTTYGSTIKQSWLLYLATYDVLKAIERTKIGGVLLHDAEVSSKGSVARDPVTQWPTTYSSWLILAAEVAAA